MSRWENFKNEWLLGSSVFSTSRDARNDGLFSPDRLRLLSGGDEANPEVRIWDVETGSCLRVFKGHKQPVAALAWTEDQRLVASGAFGREVAFGKRRQRSASVS